MGWRVDLPRREWHPPPFALSLWRTTSGRPVVAASGELDLSTVPIVKKAIAAAADEGGSPVLVDLARVTLVDSTTIHVLVDATRRLQAAGRELVVVAPERYVRGVLDLTGADRVLRVVDELPEPLLPD
jgi:anti-anti-sigma factor